MSSSEDKVVSVETSSSNNMSDDLNQFLSECERDFSKRYTEEDSEFAALLRKDPPSPPIVSPWYGRPPDYSRGRDGGRRNDRRRPYDDRSHNHYNERNRYNPRQRNDDRSNYGNRRYDDRYRH
ncbi:RNA guanine-N7 methyltransferase activating subunit-like [Ischnura elegans]|uniref:RNA guanine-N7 methyltransferase activating subunit-like n=1 Tax=Ischnura elegans TaxID=197161 RepID=UPI001ED88223|nr:RNA guanine-N7 methyltransferase activating subunit-like [Ischnura elegans]